MKDEELYAFIWTQMDEMEEAFEPGEQEIDSFLGIPDGVTDEQFTRVLAQVEADRETDRTAFECGRCSLHGTNVEHDLHVAQNLPDPFTGKRPRGGTE